MKKLFIYLFSTFIIILNIYLIFCWQPQSEVSIKEENSKETISYSKTLFKVDKEKALEQLSSDDKRDLEKILKKLSTLDMGRIKTYYEDSNEEEGIINAFKLLKKRLISEDYKRMVEISSSFIEMNNVSQKIKK